MFVVTFENIVIVIVNTGLSQIMKRGSESIRNSNTRNADNVTLLIVIPQKRSARSNEARSNSSPSNEVPACVRA